MTDLRAALAASAALPALREQPLADPAIPRMELVEWAERYGVVAGITTRGHGFSLGLWSEENVGQVMTRWRAFRAAFLPQSSGPRDKRRVARAAGGRLADPRRRGRSRHGRARSAAEHHGGGLRSRLPRGAAAGRGRAGARRVAWCGGGDPRARRRPHQAARVRACGRHRNALRSWDLRGVLRGRRGGAVVLHGSGRNGPPHRGPAGDPRRAGAAARRG